MIRCWCCERRWPDSADEIMGPCGCADDYCDHCLACVGHCQCADGFIVVRRREEGAELRE